MKADVPAHYTAFRITLVVVLAAALVLLVRWVVDPRVLAEILDLLGLG